MNFIESIQTCYKKTFNFKDRASKSEFWWFYLYDGIIYVASEMTLRTDPNDNLIYPDGIIALGLILTILFFINVIPAAVVGVRRLHDTSRSRWWYLLFIIPLITLVALYFCTNDGSKDKNRFGSKPKK